MHISHVHLHKLSASYTHNILSAHNLQVACYKNKIVNYRQGTETDLSEVLQAERVFTNVSKGEFANSKILQKCFDTANEEEVCRFILDKGSVQVSDQERSAQLENTIREVASMVAEKCVNPANRRPYTIPQIRDAMKSAGFMVHPTRNVKQQFLDCVKLLQKKKGLDIERAKMQLAIVLLDTDDCGDDNDIEERRKNVLNLLLDEGVAKSDILPPKNNGDDANDMSRIIFLSDPSLYRKMDTIARNESVHGRLEIIQQCVAEVGDVTLGDELERRAQHQKKQQDDNDAAEVEADRNTSSVEITVNEELESGVANLSMKENKQAIDNDKYQYDLPKSVGNSRKTQKAAQKKSKKAKRREKEEQSERDERIAAEKTRQKERAERLGIVDDENTITDSTGAATNNNLGNNGGTKPCNTCGGAFTPGEYRSHFRSDWHRYNVKLKMKSVAPVSEREFQLCDADAFFE